MKWSTFACLMAPLSICLAFVVAEHHASAAGANEPQKPISAQDPTMRAGQAIYVDVCSGCHAESGIGVPTIFPALKGDPVVLAADPASAIGIVLRGAKSAATYHAPTGTAMPAMGWKLSDEEIAAVITYIRNSWGNAASAVPTSTVHSIRQEDCTGVGARLHLQSYFNDVCGGR
jgi:mono/diheme cytochrome c family protein